MHQLSCWLIKILSEFKLYKWLRVNALDRLSITFHISSDITPPPTEEIWKERREAVGAMKAYLTDMPGMLHNSNRKNIDSHFQPPLRLFMVPREVERRACCRQFLKRLEGMFSPYSLSRPEPDYMIIFRKALIIDCRELHKATSDTQLVGALAGQTGYWPVFTFLNSMNNLIDLASVGLMGQKGSPPFFWALIAEY